DLPYQVNKARLIEKIDEQVKSKRIQGVSFVRDESDRNDPVRIVIELKRDANPNVTLNQLYSSTQLQDAFNANMLALVPDANGVLTPQTVTLRDCLTLYINHQKDVILRRTRFDLDRAEARLHIIEGLRKAIDIINEVIRVIRAAANEPAAREALSENFGFSERQAQHIVDMRLGRLTGLERDKLEAEHAELVERITHLRRILVEEALLVETVRNELIDIRDRYGDERRTSIDPFEDEEIMDEDLIPVEDVVVTLTHFGYVKRLPTDTYQMQHRGGRGVTAMQTREDDYAEVMLVTSTHSTLLFLTDKGRGYILRAWQIPSAGRQARGTAIVNLLQLEGDEKVETMLPIPDFDTECYLTFATRSGQVKKTHLSEFTNINRRGIIAINLREDDALLSAILTHEDDDLFLVTHKGSAIRFSAADVRPTGRASQGVRGIRLADDDYVAGFLRIDPAKKLLLVTENGFGKRTDLSEFRVQNRGGSGVLCYRLTSRTGNLAGIGLVKNDDDLILLNDNGVIIRMPVEEIPVLGRVTQGVTLMRTRDGLIVDGAVVPSEDNTDDIVGEAVCSAATRPVSARAKDDAEDIEQADIKSDADDDTDDNIDYDVHDDVDNDSDYEGEDDSDL
ncbi:MAG: DNA gyrase subunit A, partial [Clostridiaceae bacterium]|nr:DNA gyrase subunit A [Clostridiaceae bacterium]